MRPIDPMVADLVERLSPDLREDFEERAGIIEYDAGLPRAHAESLALVSVLSRHPSAVSGVTALRVPTARGYRYLLTTHLEDTRARLASRGEADVTVVDLAHVLREYHGTAALIPDAD